MTQTYRSWAILAAFALLDPDHHATAVDVTDLEPADFPHPETSAIRRGQRRTIAQSRHRLEKGHDLIGRQHHRQLLRLAGADDLGHDVRLIKRDTVEEA
jgi:hypothetical protein